MTDEPVPVEDIEPAEDIDPGESDDHEPEDGRLAATRREAAGYRKKLAESKKENERLTTLAEGLARAAVESVAAGSLSNAALLWKLSTAQPLDLLTDDGTVDSERLRSAVAEVVEALPESRRRQPSSDLGARRGSARSNGASWASFVAEGRRRRG